MGVSEREHHVKVLEQFLHDYQEWGEVLELEKTIKYAISSLKTDEAYQLMYEGEEIYTKADVMAMLTELQLEIEELKNEPACCHHYKRGVDWSSNIIQQKINALKGVEDDNR